MKSYKYLGFIMTIYWIEIVINAIKYFNKPSNSQLFVFIFVTICGTLFGITWIMTTRQSLSYNLSQRLDINLLFGRLALNLARLPEVQNDVDLQNFLQGRCERMFRNDKLAQDLNDVIEFKKEFLKMNPIYYDDFFDCERRLRQVIKNKYLFYNIRIFFLNLKLKKKFITYCQTHSHDPVTHNFP